MKRVVQIVKSGVGYDDVVKLSWYLLIRRDISQVTKTGVGFVAKNVSNLEEGDVLMCEDGYKIFVSMAKDKLCVLEFEDEIEFANLVYRLEAEINLLFCKRERLLY